MDTSMKALDLQLLDTFSKLNYPRHTKVNTTESTHLEHIQAFKHHKFCIKIMCRGVRNVCKTLHL